MRDRRDLTFAGLLLLIMGALTWAGLEAQPGHNRPANLAPNPRIRSVAIEAAPGDSADLTITWGAAIVRPGGAVADLHVLDVVDQDTALFLVTDSVPASAASGTTLASTVRVPTDTVPVPFSACVQAFHQGLSSARPCATDSIPARMHLEDPTAPQIQVEIDSVVVLPDSATIAVGDSVQLTAWIYSGDAVVGCSGNCTSVGTLQMEPVLLASNGTPYFLRWSTEGEKPPPYVTGPTWVVPYDRGVYDLRQPLLAALWRSRARG